MLKIPLSRDEKYFIYFLQISYYNIFIIEYNDSIFLTDRDGMKAFSSNDE